MRISVIFLNYLEKFQTSNFEACIYFKISINKIFMICNLNLRKYAQPYYCYVARFHVTPIS